MLCVSHAFASVHCLLVVTCWERANLFALVGDVNCILITFPCGILDQVWYLIVLFPDFLPPFLLLYDMNSLIAAIIMYIRFNKLHQGY